MQTASEIQRPVTSNIAAAKSKASQTQRREEEMKKEYARLSSYAHLLTRYVALILSQLVSIFRRGSVHFSKAHAWYTSLKCTQCGQVF